jgi:hypothetical protein
MRNELDGREMLATVGGIPLAASTAPARSTTSA